MVLLLPEMRKQAQKLEEVTEEMAFKAKRESASRQPCASALPVYSSSNLLWIFTLGQ